MRSFTPWSFFPSALEPPATRSLSLLFIIKEWISSMRVVKQLQALGVEATQNTSALKSLEKLLSNSLENPFTQQGGLLDKLCFYSNILVQASKVAEETLDVLLEEMQQGILRLRGLFLQAKKVRLEANKIELSFDALYSLLEQKLLKFFSALVPYLQEARTDENVLIYLIEEKQTLNDFLGNRAIEELLRCLFPAGQPHLRAVICEGFTRRGFASFFTEKEPLIEELEWEAPCQPPMNSL